MNIFYLDSSASIAAQYHVDKHVVKMILESAQLLCTAHRVIDGTQTKIAKTTKAGKVKSVAAYQLQDSHKDSLLYSVTHINHPSAVWCRANINNYMWLYELFVHLCEEYTYRYGKRHKTDLMLSGVLKSAPISISTHSFTQPAQAMPEKYRCSDSIQAYRQYYINEKRSFAKWSKRNVPDWFI